MKNFNLNEIKELNSRSAKAIGFLFAAIIASLGWGFYQDSLPAFLLAGVFLFLVAAESREYKKSYKIELEASDENQTS